MLFDDTTCCELMRVLETAIAAVSRSRRDRKDSIRAARCCRQHSRASTDRDRCYDRAAIAPPLCGPFSLRSSAASRRRRFERCCSRRCEAADGRRRSDSSPR